MAGNRKLNDRLVIKKCNPKQFKKFHTDKNEVETHVQTLEMSPRLLLWSKTENFYFEVKKRGERETGLVTRFHDLVSTIHLVDSSVRGILAACSTLLRRRSIHAPKGRENSCEKGSYIIRQPTIRVDWALGSLVFDIWTDKVGVGRQRVSDKVLCGKSQSVPCTETTPVCETT